MERDPRKELKMKLDSECLKRSKYGSCCMECELPNSKMGYCREVWKAIEK